MQIRGSQPGLFGAGNLLRHSTAILVEGEFDAMLLDQEAGDLVGVATFGSASVREIPYKWIATLLSCRRIFIAGDNDRAGNEFMNALSGFSRRFRCIQVPEGKDITQFWQIGGNLRDWVERTLKEDAREQVSNDE